MKLARIGNNKYSIKNTDRVTNEALIECEKVFFEYRNNVNTIELQLEQNNHICKRLKLKLKYLR